MHTRGKRVDDRRVISGITHVLKSGGRWVDAAGVYGPRNRSTTGSSVGPPRAAWINLFHALANAGGPPAQVLIDGLAVKAHRSASGAKGRAAKPSAACV